MIKKERKNKTILISLISVAIVSLITIGFSSWLIGPLQTSVNSDLINVKIDTVNERTSYLNIVVAKDDNGLNIADTVTDNENDGISVLEANPDLEIKLDSFVFAFADNPKTTFNSINFSITTNKSDSGLPKGKINDNDLLNRSSDNHDYIKLEYDTITADEFETLFYLDKENQVNGYKIYSIKNNSSSGDLSYPAIKFTWGSFFGGNGQSPAAFYQSEIDKRESIKDKLEVLNLAKTELQSMEDAFRGLEITLKVKLNVNFGE